jgi:hypothetical protein
VIHRQRVDGLGFPGIEILLSGLRSATFGTAIKKLL